MQKTIAVIAAAGLVALLGIVWWVNRAPADRFATCREASAGSGAAAIGGPFDLTDENGKPMSDTQLITKPTLLYFGYTFCPDVCPLDNARNAEALDILQKNGHDAQMAFISVDPHRDTPDRLREVRGVGSKTLKKIKESWGKHRGIQRIMVFLTGHGVAPSGAVKAPARHGASALEVVRAHPYRLAEGGRGVGCLTAGRTGRGRRRPAAAPPGPGSPSL